MNKDLGQLILFLKKAGYNKHATQLEQKLKPEKIELSIDPLSFAVSLGLINPSVLETLEEEGHEEDLEDFKTVLKELEKSK